MNVEFKPGLGGVVAVETAIAAPDREGGALRYRGYDIEELVGRYAYENVWGLLVDDDIDSKMPDPEPYVPTGPDRNAPADLQSEVAHLAGEWKLKSWSTSTTTKRVTTSPVSADDGDCGALCRSRGRTRTASTTPWRKARPRRRSSCFAGAGG